MAPAGASPPDNLSKKDGQLNYQTRHQTEDTAQFWPDSQSALNWQKLSSTQSDLLPDIPLPFAPSSFELEKLELQKFKMFVNQEQCNFQRAEICYFCN